MDTTITDSIIPSIVGRENLFSPFSTARCGVVILRREVKRRKGGTTMTPGEYLKDLVRSLYSDHSQSFFCAQVTERVRDQGRKVRLGLDLLMAGPLDEEGELNAFLEEKNAGYNFPITVTILPACFQGARGLDDKDNTSVEFTLKPFADLEEVAEQLLLLRSIFKFEKLSVVVHGLTVEVGKKRSKAGIVGVISAQKKVHWQSDQIRLAEALRTLLGDIEANINAPPPGSVWTSGRNLSISHNGATFRVSRA